MDDVIAPWIPYYFTTLQSRILLENTVDVVLRLPRIGWQACFWCSTNHYWIYLDTFRSWRRGKDTAVLDVDTPHPGQVMVETHLGERLGNAYENCGVFNYTLFIATSAAEHAASTWIMTIDSGTITVSPSVLARSTPEDIRVFNFIPYLHIPKKRYRADQNNRERNRIIEYHTYLNRYTHIRHHYICVCSLDHSLRLWNSPESLYT